MPKLDLPLIQINTGNCYNTKFQKKKKNQYIIYMYIGSWINVQMELSPVSSHPTTVCSSVEDPCLTQYFWSAV